MFKFNLSIIQLLLLFSTLLLASCSSGDSSSTEQTFSIEVSDTPTQIEAGESFEFSVTINKDDNVTVNYELAQGPSFGSLIASDDLSLFTYTSTTTLGQDTFTLRFFNESMSVTHEVSYVVVTNPDSVNKDDEVNEEEGGNELDNTTSYSVLFPSDYLTLFENETVTFDINRNYQVNDDENTITETFYFNIHNVEGSVAEDSDLITLTAQDGNEDTYGEILVVTDVNGVRFESKMDVVYFNKNRDLTTTEPPLIALLDTDISIEPYSTTTKVFDVYDSDSDRIAYRILSAPSYIATHINKSTSGFDLTIYTIDEIDENDNQLILEVSDAHNTDTYTFNLIKNDNSSQAINTRPNVYIEDNVAVSLIQKMDGTETDIITELAFAYNDSEDDLSSESITTNNNLDISVSGSSTDFSYRVNFPYVYVMADDISDLQYEQVTITVSDGQFNSKLTYHLYTDDNYSTFLGGNPNTAPFTDLPSSIDILESKTIEQAFTASDFELHDFDMTVDYINGESVASLSDTIINTTSQESKLTIVASSPSAALTTQVTVSLEDVFGALREHVIDVNIYKNSAPVITLSETDIRFTQQQNIDVTISINDVDENNIQPTFSYDMSVLTLSYNNGILTVSSYALSTAYTGEIQVYAEDEFGEITQEIITVTVDL